MSDERRIKLRPLGHKPQPTGPVQGWVEHDRPLDPATADVVARAVRPCWTPEQGEHYRLEMHRHSDEKAEALAALKRMTDLYEEDVLCPGASEADDAVLAARAVLERLTGFPCGSCGQRGEHFSECPEKTA